MLYAIYGSRREGQLLIKHEVKLSALSRNETPTPQSGPLGNHGDQDNQQSQTSIGLSQKPICDFWGAEGAPILFSVLGFSMASCS